MKPGGGGTTSLTAPTLSDATANQPAVAHPLIPHPLTSYSLIYHPLASYPLPAPLSLECPHQGDATGKSRVRVAVESSGGTRGEELLGRVAHRV